MRCSQKRQWKSWSLGFPQLQNICHINNMPLGMVNIASSFWVIFPISDSSALTHKDTPSPWLVSHHLKCIQGPKGTSFWSSWSCDKRWGLPTPAVEPCRGSWFSESGDCDLGQDSSHDFHFLYLKMKTLFFPSQCVQCSTSCFYVVCMCMRDCIRPVILWNVSENLEVRASTYPWKSDENSCCHFADWPKQFCSQQ